MSNQWFRMYAEIATDPKVQCMSESMQRRLMMLLCFRCGDVLATLHATEIAFALRISEEELAETKALFIQKKFIDEDWNIMNWDKRQYVSDSSTERSRKHREQKKQDMQQECNVAASPPEQNRTDTEHKDIVLCAKSQKPKKTPEKKNGERLSRGWELPEEWGKWAEEQGLSYDEIVLQCDKFKDYWIAKAGKMAVKLDWQATWRNWIRTYLERKAG